MASKEAPPVECKAMLDGGAMYLDVRTPQEFEQGHYEGAKNVPLMLMESGSMTKNPEFMNAISAEFKDKDAKIVVSCKVGRRGAMAVSAMQDAGYTNLTNMEGGYDAWVAAGL